MKRVLIIAGGLQIGGAEKVAANISKYAPADKFEFHYVIFQGYYNVYGKEIEERGGKVFEVPSPSAGYLRYAKYMGELMERYQYCAIHSHTMFNSGINLTIACSHHIPIRIVHSHTTRTETRVSIKQKIYELIMRQLILVFATDLFACGRDAGVWLYGKKAFKKRGKIIFNGIDIAENRFSNYNRAVYRKILNAEDKFLIGHVGSLMHVKNQIFLIRLMPKILQLRPDAFLIFIGEGEDYKYLSDEINRLGLEKKILLYGSTMEVHNFLSALDVFAFPSLREGTPLSVLEAETNGLPCIVSDHVPEDILLTDLVTRLSLQDTENWIQKICSARRSDPEKYAMAMGNTGYSATVSYMPIYEAYEKGL